VLMRIAMWSGPRNLSTAMMYAFGARADCAVWDEPFYAAYLAATGIEHPMRSEIMSAGETDPECVAKRCAGPVPAGKRHFYQKHMAHHMVDGFPRDWLAGVVNVFLIRHPARVIASYANKREHPTLADIGFQQQADLFSTLADSGATPVVIDSMDILANPEQALRALCGAISLPFDPAMLSWPRGGHMDDGVWASHWYGAAHDSTGFARSEGKLPQLEGPYAALADRALPFYGTLKDQALTV